MASKLILLPELVPESAWNTNLRSMLSSQEWDRVRKDIYLKASYKCEVCGGKGVKWPVECHEVWEYDEAKGVQKLVRLIALCPACHEVKHIGLAEMKGHLDNALKHMCKVNGIKRPEADRIVSQAFEDWNRRSHKDWKPDISLLKDLVRSLGGDIKAIKLGSKRRR